ncbi:TetR/AcrR family transcriptional regulator [Variovorax sp. EBFNA2]|uniref:TetR/AcrR family transcriptional regulator n=1 Tax=Variovorax sp. EBFNA2 TaxID=3342097 RepID=UPI0029C0F107|nr:TetR/AcrR family transcriptional regulator [Variovorax boronicumulans]WPG37841.1 TetR/AcrR family transcriptional regulator [Variovorax boronicumulans]
MTEPDPPGRRERRRTHTLDHVASTAMRLFEAQGYDATTMEQIAQQSDVAKGTLYNHFPTKEAILAHWVHLELVVDAQRLHASIDPKAGFTAQLTGLLDASAEWSERYRVYLLDYFRFRFLNIESELGGGGDRSTPRDLSGLFEALIAAAQQAGTLRTDVSAAHLASLLHHLYFGALMRWLTLPGLVLRDEFAVVVDLFVGGARPAPKPAARRRTS